MEEVLVLVEHIKGKITDTTFEVLVLGKEMATSLGKPLKAVLLGQNTGALVGELGGVDGIYTMSHELLDNINHDTWAAALSTVIDQKKPAVFLMGSTNALMGLPAYLADKMNLPFINLAKSMTVEGGQVVGNVLLYGGKIEGNVKPQTGTVLMALRPGNYQGDTARVSGQPPTEAITVPETVSAARVRFKSYIEPDTTDIDLTQVEVLIAVGRGVESQDNVELAEELAGVFKNAAVAASRPVIDQGWLPLTRQVGKSGAIVKPKVYLAFGISGAPEHVEGMKNSSLIVSVNTDPEAPMLSFSHYGVEGDAAEIMETLLEGLE
jgi:electron transfer flavoprotein alpha subunit